MNKTLKRLWENCREGAKKLLHSQAGKLKLANGKLTLDTKQGFKFLLWGLGLTLLLGWGANIYMWSTTWLYGVAVLGLLVGIANMFHEEAIMFLLSTVTFAFMVALLINLQLFPLWVTTLGVGILSFVAPAAIVVSLKTMYALATK
ncbi:hypothetical protein HZB00_01150 [Candidatus Woesearchaeota archaeon]|nr:hypothetical protein [Candidatus Woesearchaeota archaeon]